MGFVTENRIARIGCYLGVLINLSACASTTSTPVARDTLLVSSSAAPVCGRQGAQKVAFQQAAVETLRRGFDKFVIVGAQQDSDVRVVGTTPIYGTSNISGGVMGSTFYGTGTSTVYGGQPIYGGSHDQEFAIRMFSYRDPGAEDAIDARSELGPEWIEKIKEDKVTCF